MTNGGPPRDHTSEAMYRAILDNSPLLVAELDRQGRFLMANPALARVFNLSPPQLVGKTFSDLLPEHFSSLFLGRIQEVTSNKAPVTVEDHFTAGSNDRCFMTTLYPLLDTAGQVTSIGAIAHDITDRKRYEMALKESENNLKEAQKITRLGRWELEIASGRLSWSDTIFDLFELPRDAFAASYEAFLEFVHPDDRALVNRVYQESVARKRPYELEHRLLMKDGRIKWVNEIGRTEYDDQGRPIRSIGAVQDISERKILLELLSRLNQSNGLEALMAEVTKLMREWSGCDAVGIRLQDGDDFPYYQTQGFPVEFVRQENRLCSLDDRGEVIRDSQGNAVLECMCGNVIRGRFDPAQPFFSENGSFWTNSTTQLLAATSASDRQARTRNRCYGEGYESVALIPLRFGEQNLGLLQFNDRRPGRFTEATIALLERLGANLAMGLAHHRTAEALARSHDLLSNLARLVPGVIYQYRLYPDGRSAFPYASPGIQEIAEMDPEQVREDATPVYSRLHPEDYDQVIQAIERSAITLQTFYCEFRVMLPRQGLRWLWSQAHPERMPDGSTLWHGIISDITERKNLETQLLQAQKMESVGRLAGGVAHDYNNMLSVIMGYTEMALEKVPPDDPLHGDLLEIFKAGQRSTDITRQLLAFARKQTIDPKVIDLNERVEGMLRMLRRLIGEEIELSWHPARQLWPLKMDPSQVTQILANLCVNARDAIDGVGKITIATDCCSFDGAYCANHRDHAVGDYVRLAVGDSGCGMDQAVLNYIFEPFFTTKDVNEGTGLGLATVYGIVQQNGGFITVQSETGRGTTFNIYLPRCLDAEQQAQPDIKSAPPATRGETVLLVEDEPAILRMGEMMLKHLGYRVLAAGTPAKALLTAKEQERPIELLITDVVMPEMNGRQLSEQLQALYPGVKTLYMSGYTADMIAHRGVLEEGMNFIQKPYSTKELGAKVRMVLDQS